MNAIQTSPKIVLKCNSIFTVTSQKVWKSLNPSLLLYLLPYLTAYTTQRSENRPKRIFVLLPMTEKQTTESPIKNFLYEKL